MTTKRNFVDKILLFFVLFASGCNRQLTLTPPTTTNFFTTQTATNQSMIDIQGSTPVHPIFTETLEPISIQTPSSELAVTQVIVPISNPSIIGLSTGGYPIEVYQYGDGPDSVVLIGGIHGGYEWNTILLAYEFIDYFNTNPGIVPARLAVYIIPSTNPDGQVKVVGHNGRFLPNEIFGETLDGRYNANGVDLNRNWDCNWSPDAYWRDQKINPGEMAFSETETRLLRDFILTKKPISVIFWHSAYPGVFYGSCQDMYQSSQVLATIYANSAQYPEIAEFSGYKVTGDAADWLSNQGIPTIEVELSDHQNTEFEKNLEGVISVLKFLAEQNASGFPIATPSP